MAIENKSFPVGDDSFVIIVLSLIDFQVVRMRDRYDHQSIVYSRLKIPRISRAWNAGSFLGGKK